MPVQDAVMPLDLASVAIHSVGQLFWGGVLKVDGLTGIRTHSGSDEEQPRQQIGPVGGRPDEATRLFAEVEQDGARIEHPRLAPARSLGVNDRRHLAVRIDSAKGGRML